MKKNNTNYNFTVENEVFEEVFFDDFNDNGYQVTGVPIDNLKYSFDEKGQQVLNMLPDEIKSNDWNFLIKSSNLKSFIENNLLTTSEMEDDECEKIINIIKKHEPEKIISDEYKCYVDSDSFDEMSDKIKDFLIQKTTLTINNEKIYVFNSDLGLSSIIVEYYNTYYK